MNIQYFSNSKGQTTGVFIPINDWINFKTKASSRKIKERGLQLCNPLLKCPEKDSNLHVVTDTSP